MQEIVRFNVLNRIYIKVNVLSLNIIPNHKSEVSLNGPNKHAKIILYGFLFNLAQTNFAQGK